MDSKMLTDDENFTSLDDLVDTGSVDFLSAPESQLCVPTDSIDDVDFFPSFKDDFISLNGLDFMFDFGGFQANAEEEEETENLQNSNPSSAYSNTVSSGSPEEQSGGESSGIGEFCGGFVYRKGRSKRGGGGRSWSAKKNHLAFAMAVEEEKKKKTRCTHCQTDTTPQWRMGPEGPKTLCNACGVRYKSGRLVPEYRPAASPTFDCRKHSNFHRKILKRKGIC